MRCFHLFIIDFYINLNLLFLMKQIFINWEWEERKIKEKTQILQIQKKQFQIKPQTVKFILYF